MDPVGVERVANLLGERPELDRDLALGGREDGPFALEHVDHLVVRNAIGVLPHATNRVGRQRRRSELDRRVVYALRERRREHIAALRQRVTQEPGNIDVRVQLVDDPNCELVTQGRLLDERTDCAHVRVRVEDERARPHRDERDEREDARENDERNRTDRARPRRSECCHSAG